MLAVRGATIDRARPDVRCLAGGARAIRRSAARSQWDIQFLTPPANPIASDVLISRRAIYICIYIHIALA